MGRLRWTLQEPSGGRFSGPYSYACCITCFVAYEFLGGVFPWFVWRVLCCRGGLCICLRSSLVYIVNS